MLGHLFLQKLSKSCLYTVRSQDDLIHCFKEGQPCFQGREVLRSQLMILRHEENHFENPSESDVEEAYASCHLHDQDEEGDKDIDVL